MGSTPGHVHPALAVADAVRSLDPSADLLFVSAAAEESRAIDAARAIEARGYRLELIPASPLKRTTRTARARGAWQVVTGGWAARRLLARHRTQIAIGFGSYVSGGVLLAARTRGLVTAIHEANVVPGLANRLLGRVVDRVYLGVPPSSHWWYPASRGRLFGTPIRREIAALADEPRLPPTPPAHVLVMGGTSGTAFFGREMPRLASRLAARGIAIEVRHQVGAEDQSPIARAYTEAGVHATLTQYIDDIASAYRWATLVIARSGASVISELAAAALPALLVPWSAAADDHQAVNAEVFVRAGGGVWSREETWSTDVLAGQLAALLSDRVTWQRASEGARSLARPDAAMTLATDALALAREKK